jgi:hypothetical protein
MLVIGLLSYVWGTLYWKDTNKNCKFVIFSFCKQNVRLLLSRAFYKREYKWQAGIGLSQDSGLLQYIRL